MSADLDPSRIEAVAASLGAPRLLELAALLDARVNELLALVEAGALEAAIDLAHQLCGSAGALGMPDLAARIRRLETVLPGDRHGWTEPTADLHRANLDARAAWARWAAADHSSPPASR